MQTVLPSADTAAMLFWALLASGQINMRNIDGWQTLATKPRRLKRYLHFTGDCAIPIFNHFPDGTKKTRLAGGPSLILSNAAS
jgi:hypothetical protein